MFSVSKRMALLGLLFSILTNQIVQTDKLKIFPKVEKGEQVIEQGSTLTLTCIKNLSDNLIELRWTLPKFQTSLPAIFRHGRLEKITFKNETHLVSTMTLTNTTRDDTGFYNCSGNWEQEDRYVYVSSTENLSLMRNQNYIFPRFNLTATTRDSIFIHFIITHPNVTISIFKQTREIGVQPQKAFRKIFDSSSPTVNSRWSFHPRNGLAIKNPTVSDSSIYYVVSYLRFVNGKRVDIKHDKTTKEFLSWIIPPNELNYSSEWK
ncbi:uncharacterized protein LOC124348757 isoform X2 [Daphnia pulicaria]|uniref:uncharacterized protein LOC124348757 isoform X2 n=1 Tax=Daphnia pulicaria TaxID=35523 RepID=UPI001EEA13AE|nr:uncharacterized protein LOC124348757 isoform X2 [Daphnia pulicaria]